MMENFRVPLIAEAILLHLRQYPASADTLEGINLWWIDSLALGAGFLDTVLALEHLEAQGHVERVLITGRQLWRKARPKTEELTGISAPRTLPPYA